jgi:hypothetical protein
MGYKHDKTKEQQGNDKQLSLMRKDYITNGNGTQMT